MNAKEFRDWLEDHSAFEELLEWLDTLPDPTLQAAWKECPRGDWMLWLHDQVGTDPELLAPVIFAALDRTLARAIRALDDAGIEHSLWIGVETAESARAAADAAIRAAERAAGRAAVAALAAREAVEVAELAAEAAWGNEPTFEVARAAVVAASQVARAVRRNGAPAASPLDARTLELAFAVGTWGGTAAVEAERLKCADDCRALLAAPAIGSANEI